MGLGLVGRGLAPLFQGSAFYPNYWGGAVFAPIAAVIIGEVVMVVAIFERRQNRHEASRPKLQHHQ